MSTSSYFREHYSDYSSDYLIELRAKGDLLVPEAQLAIEQLLMERGEAVPPLPVRPVLFDDRETRIASDKKSPLGVLGATFLALALFATLKYTTPALGAVIAICFVAYFVIRWIGRESMSPQERAEDLKEEKREKEGLTELMASAADGDLTRVKELIAYGANVNATNSNGVTALMLAARNNQVAIVKCLLDGGANANVKSAAGKTALEVAKIFNSTDVVALLEQSLRQ